jgi:hypothetical protein
MLRSACRAINSTEPDARTVGPDLARPMNATSYLTDSDLRALIRDPRAFRTWPQQRMPGFTAKALAGADLDALILYLKYKAVQKSQRQ